MPVPAPLTGILRCHGHLAALVQRPADLPSPGRPRGRRARTALGRRGGPDRGPGRRRGERVVPAASTIKVPILVAVLRLVARGDLGLADRVQLGDDRVGGSGPLAALTSVTQLPVGELLDLMITLSDNDATNALLDLVGVGVVDRLCPELGMGRTSLRRRLMDLEAARAGRDNTTCAADLARVLVLLRRGELLPPSQTRAGPRRPRGPAVRRRPAGAAARGRVARQQDRRAAPGSVTT